MDRRCMSHTRISDRKGCGRISDQGGGIAPDELSKVWQYGYTTIDHQDSGCQGTSDLDAVWASQPELVAQYRMGGLGFGLPMSRLYAEYFGESQTSAELGISMMTVPSNLACWMAAALVSLCSGSVTACIVLQCSFHFCKFAPF